MDIILTVASNTFIALMLVLGVLVGLKNEWKLSLTKLILTCGIGVGLYFLNPILCSLIAQIPFITELLLSELVTVVTFKSIIFAVSFGISFGLLSLILAIIRHYRNKVRKLKAQNGVLINRAKALDKNTEKTLKKEAKKLEKQKRKEIKKQHKIARIFGAIIECLVAIIAVFVLFIPTKAILNNELKDLHIEEVYTNTMYGQLDKATNVVEFIIK